MAEMRIEGMRAETLPNMIIYHFHFSKDCSVQVKRSMHLLLSRLQNFLEDGRVRTKTPEQFMLLRH